MFRKPAPLSEFHIIEGFDCGKPLLNNFLTMMALTNQRQGFSRTFVTAAADFEVAGYYSLCAGMISRDDAPRHIGGHGSPKEIPVALLGRLGVDRRHQGRGLGELLLRSALAAVYSASQHVGFRAVMVDALDDGAALFYAKYGFRSARSDPLRLFMQREEVEISFEEAPFRD